MNMHNIGAQTQTTITTTTKADNTIGTKCTLALGRSRNMSDDRTNNLEPSSVPHKPPQLTEETRMRIAQLRGNAFEFFSKTLELYETEQLMFCFNGGKDCTVLLDLLMSYCRVHGISSRAIPMLYIQSDDAFAEIDEFVEFSVRHYNVELIQYKDSLKQALQLMSADMPRIKAVFIGSRNTDPYCGHLAPMQPTDNGWPPMMRLNPLLEWSYHDVWNYIHMNQVPYCRLYDEGYTSIGYKSNTLPNPHLFVSAAGCRCRSDVTDSGDIYRPAWELVDATQERAGRILKKK